MENIQKTKKRISDSQYFANGMPFVIVWKIFQNIFCHFWGSVRNYKKK